MGKLVNGLIAANAACPFLSICKLKIHSCPGGANGTRSIPFSCAAARLHDGLSTLSAKVKEAVTIQPGNPHGDDVIMDDEGYSS